MAKLFKIVEDHKAGKGLRFLNYIIDLGLAYAIVIMIYMIIGIFIGITSGDVENTNFEYLENINPLLDRILTLISYALIMFFTEAVTKGRSIGKYITGTMVVRTDATQLKVQDYLLETFAAQFPLIS